MLFLCYHPRHYYRAFGCRLFVSQRGASSAKPSRKVFKIGPKCSEKSLKTVIEEKRQVYEFDEFRVDAAKRQLLREGEVVPLYSKAFDLLLLLVQSGGRDLSKDQILETIWPGQILEESNLIVNISAMCHHWHTIIHTMATFQPFDVLWVRRQHARVISSRYPDMVIALSQTSMRRTTKPLGC